MRESAVDFGRLLRAQRERRGVALAQIAASTKIKLSLLVALEQSDITRWPKGIYGRAFLRAYADAIGLGEDSLIDDVLQLLRASEEGPSASSDADVPEAAPSVPLRLTFDADVAPPRHTARHALDAAVTLAAVLLVAGLAAAAIDVHFLSAAAVIALVWYPMAHALLGGFSPTRLFAKHRRSGTLAVPHDPEANRQAFGEYQVTN